MFLIQGYGRWQGAKLGLISSLALVALLSIPLAISFREILFRSAVVEELRVLKDEFPLWEEAQLNDLHIDFGGDEKVISLRVDAAPGAIGKEDVRAMEEAFGKRFGESVKVRVLRVRFDIISSD